MSSGSMGPVLLSPILDSLPLIATFFGLRMSQALLCAGLLSVYLLPVSQAIYILSATRAPSGC
jgi:hypothetical protein